jgi:hypothetical protein
MLWRIDEWGISLPASVDLDAGNLEAVNLEAVNLEAVNLDAGNLEAEGAMGTD